MRRGLWIFARRHKKLASFRRKSRDANHFRKPVGVDLALENYFLDANIVVYAVAGQPPFQPRARNHISALDAAGHRFAVSELTWTECLVSPVRAADGALLLEYHRFLCGSNLKTISMTAAILRRAAIIRGIHRHGLADSLHLAAAIEASCDRFLTNDHGLANFPDVPVDILP